MWRACTAAAGDRIVAVGTLTGTVQNAVGNVIGTVLKTIQMVVNITDASCDILHLELGPLDLDLLGLEVHLNQIVLDIDADPTGGLLGALLCAVANLLDVGGRSPRSSACSTRYWRCCEGCPAGAGGA